MAPKDRGHKTSVALLWRCGGILLTLWNAGVLQPAWADELGNAPGSAYFAPPLVRAQPQPTADGVATEPPVDYESMLTPPEAIFQNTQYSSAPAPAPSSPAMGSPMYNLGFGSAFSQGSAGMGSPPPPTLPGSIMPPPEMPAPRSTVNLSAKFGPGFQLQSDDGQFTWQMHALMQMDYRQYTHTADAPNGKVADVAGAAGPNNTFTFPRQWLIFNGTLTKNWEWMLAPSFQFDNVNLLDAWVNAHYDDRYQVKVGRYKTPFTYEFYAEPIQGLVQPERSMFFNNFGLNRQEGVMVHGTVFEQHVDYALGVYNGQRNGFLSNNNSKDLVGYFNYRPFMNWDCFALQRLDVGASFDFGYENNPPNPTATGGTPTVLRTNVATNGNLVNGVEFMQLKGTVFERGQRALGSLHAAWYYEQLTLISELQGGFDSYANTAPAAGGASHTRVPISSWYIQGGYFLTGETVTFRNVVKPLRPLTWGSGGYGAVELMSRFNYLALDNRIFTSGMVDSAGGNVWTNRVDLTDLGVNWYPNQWIKCSLLWEHAQFGNAVTYRPGQTSSYNDMLWTRMQVWF